MKYDFKRRSHRKVFDRTDDVVFRLFVQVLLPKGSGVERVEQLIHRFEADLDQRDSTLTLVMNRSFLHGGMITPVLVRDVDPRQ